MSNLFWLHMLALHFHIGEMEITFAVELWGGLRKYTDIATDSWFNSLATTESVLLGDPMLTRHTEILIDTQVLSSACDAQISMSVCSCALGKRRIEAIELPAGSLLCYKVVVSVSSWAIPSSWLAQRSMKCASFFQGWLLEVSAKSGEVPELHKERAVGPIPWKSCWMIGRVSIS